MATKISRGGRSLFNDRQLSTPKRAANSLVSVEIINLPTPSLPKAAVVASKKQFKTAVLRNLLKRRVFSILQSFNGKIKPGLGVIVYLKKDATGASYQELKQSLESILF